MDSIGQDRTGNRPQADSIGKKDRRRLDPDAAARAVADSVILGDKAAAKKHNLSIRSLRRYRARTEVDKVLSDAVRLKKEKVERDWAAELPNAIAQAVAFLSRATESLNTSDPEMVHAVTGALKILTDVAMSRVLLDARLAKQTLAGVPRQDGPPGEADRSGHTGAAPAKVVAIR